MTVPTFFRKSSEGSIASYNFTDIAEGTGVVSFYGAVDGDQSGNTRRLVTQQVYSYLVDFANTTTSSTDYNFDLSAYNLPKTAKGTAYVNCTCSNDTGASGAALFQVKKYDGATETNISSQISSPHLADQTMRLFFTKIPLTQTHIKKGENLRLTVTLVNRGGAGTGFWIGCDPKNRDGDKIKPSLSGAIITQLNFHMPFQLDL